MENLPNTLGKEAGKSGEKDDEEDDSEEEDEELEADEADKAGEEEEDHDSQAGDNDSSESSTDISEDAATESEKEESDEDEDQEEEEEESEEDTAGPAHDEEKDGDKMAQATPADPNQHALVPVVQGTDTAVSTLKNSASNKREWDTYMRQLKAQTKVPVTVSEYCTSHANRVDMFNMWLSSDKDWSKCELLLERKMEKKNEGTKGWQAIQGRVLAEKYPEEKWLKIKESRKASGLWYPDDDFPDCELEPWSELKKLWSFALQNYSLVFEKFVAALSFLFAQHISDLRKHGTTCV